jgi:mRNA-capping enzyme
MLPENMGLLFVGGMTDPFAVMHKLKKEIRALDNKIIECTLDLNTKQWIFMRERTDKSYANGYNTAVGRWMILFRLPDCLKSLRGHSARKR